MPCEAGKCRLFWLPGPDRTNACAPKRVDGCNQWAVFESWVRESCQEGEQLDMPITRPSSLIATQRSRDLPQGCLLACLLARRLSAATLPLAQCRGSRDAVHVFWCELPGHRRCGASRAPISWTDAGLGRDNAAGTGVGPTDKYLRPSASYAWQALTVLPATLAADGTLMGPAGVDYSLA
jgi:hypothetical protein